MSGGERQAAAEAENARIRSYLVSQAAKRTPEQLVEALREAQRQLLAALAAIPDEAFATKPAPGEWSAAEVLGHVRQIAALEERIIGDMTVRGERPERGSGHTEPTPTVGERAEVVAALDASRERLIATVLAADPDAHLALTWEHSMFGPLNWREWLLFARVHLLDHARQLQAIGAALPGGEAGAGR